MALTSVAAVIKAQAALQETIGSSRQARFKSLFRVAGGASVCARRSNSWRFRRAAKGYPTL